MVDRCTVAERGKWVKARGLCSTHYHQARAGKRPLPPLTIREAARNDGLCSTPEVCRRAGCSYRQLDYWTRIGAVVPLVRARGSGTLRGWTEPQADAVRALTLLSAFVGNRGAASGSNRPLSHRQLRPVSELIVNGAVGDWAGLVDGTAVVTACPREMFDANTETVVIVRFRGNKFDK